jgi:hypothetical protein
LIPSGYKEDKVYSIIPSDGSGDLDFVRGSDGTRINSLGQVENTPWNTVTNSNAFNSSPWLGSGQTLTSGQLDPFGTTNAWKVQFGSGSSYLYQPSVNKAGVVTISAWFKADTTTTIGFNDGNNYPNSITIGTTWQRYEFSFNSIGNSAIQFDNYFGVSPSAQPKTFYIYGAQSNVGSTAKPYFPTTDRLNVPRLTYENGCPSLLLEKQSTNINAWSEDLTNAAWNKYYASINSNAIISPDGTQNADKIVESPLPVTAFHYVESTNYIATGTTYTVSCFLKKAEREFGYIGVYTSQSNQIRVNLTNGTIVGTVGTWIDTKIENFGNGWYRVIGTFTKANPTYFFTGPALDATTLTYVGDGTSGIYAWGAQIEESSYATSYIPTTSTSVTRLADSCYKTGISSLIGQTSGTVFLDADVTRTTGIQIGNSTGSGDYVNSIQIAFGSSSTNINIFNGGSVQFSYATSSMTGRHKVAIAYAQNDFALYIDGAQIQLDNSGSIPSTSALIFNHVNLGTEGHLCNQVLLFKRRLTNTELAQLTTI